MRCYLDLSETFICAKPWVKCFIERTITVQPGKTHSILSVHFCEITGYVNLPILLLERMDGAIHNGMESGIQRSRSDADARDIRNTVVVHVGESSCDQQGIAYRSHREETSWDKIDHKIHI